ncbi:MAG: SRPBCC family protein, partial [Gammaproteobacteria bacterium]|nr:SRPBCC family protein [Gammaproteobacteria bacterium]
TVFALLNDFRKVREWAPFSADDPNARLTIGDVLSGEGATMSWSGQLIGEGRQTIVQSVPHERIAIDVDTGDGREATSVFDLTRREAGTALSWTWQSDYGFNLFGRYFALLQDRIRGPTMERDLARLGELAGNLPRADWGDLEIERIVVEAEDIAYITTRSLPRADAISAAMNNSFFDIYDFIDRHGLARAGAPMSITRTFSGSELVFDAAIPVRGLTDDTPRTENAVKIGETYAGTLIRVRHTGSYATLGRTHDKIAAYLAATGIERNGDAWESYVSDPGRTDASGLHTYIYYPVRN